MREKLPIFKFLFSSLERFSLEEKLGNFSGGQVFFRHKPKTKFRRQKKSYSHTESNKDTTIPSDRNTGMSWVHDAAAWQRGGEE